MKGYFVVEPLLFSLGFFMIILLIQQKTFFLKNLIKMVVTGSQNSFSVICILLLIAVVRAFCMAARTVPVLVYCGIQSLNHQSFIFFVFMLTNVVSVLLGTSLGTLSRHGFKRLSYFGRGANIFSE